MRKYWLRSIGNSSSNQLFSSMSKQGEIAATLVMKDILVNTHQQIRKWLNQNWLFAVAQFF